MLSQVFSAVFRPDVLCLIFIGVVIGNIFGCIPGLNAPIAIALALPITFVLNSFQSVALIIGLYMGCTAGGLISAILLKIPGTAANVATTFDGYPMAQQGKATEALSYGSFASLFGGMFSSVVLLLMAPILANLALQFGPWEYFGTALLALIMVCTLMGERMLKGFIAVCFGLLFTCVGLSPVDGVALRYTFGSTALDSGFNLIVVIVGIFALPELISNSNKMDDTVLQATVKRRKFYVPTLATVKRNLKVMLNGSILGTFIGILPGMGGGAASLISYEQARRTSAHPELFGTGYEEGIFCCESANNATTGGALVPMLALGVPGDTASAVIMGALMLQGVTPGPLLSMDNSLLFNSVFLIVFLANLLMWVFQASTIRWMAKIAVVPKYILFPIVALFCIAGTISIRNNPFDLAFLMLFGIIGYILSKNDYPLAPFILAFILGEFVESNLRRAITYYGSFGGCLKVPSIGTLFFFLAVALPIISVARRIYASRQKAKKKA